MVGENTHLSGLGGNVDLDDILGLVERLLFVATRCGLACDLLLLFPLCCVIPPLRSHPSSLATDALSLFSHAQQLFIHSYSLGMGQIIVCRTWWGIVKLSLICRAQSVSFPTITGEVGGKRDLNMPCR